MTGPTRPGGVFAPATFTPDPRPAAPLRRITATAGLELGSRCATASSCCWP